MKCLWPFFLLLLVSVTRAEIIETDLCIYGGTSGGVAAAVQAQRMGKTVALAVFDTHLGGLTSGGLGATDVGVVATIGGVAREFYQRVGRHYGEKERFNFEPHVARDVYRAWLEEVGVKPRWHQRLAKVTRKNRHITEITMEDGTVYRAKMFVDATYEGDLLAMAGVSFTFGREGTNVYGESLNGIRAETPKHQFLVDVDPYVVPGDPKSGLLPYIQPGAGGRPGDGDQRIQAFNYRMCFTQNPTNRLPHVVPPDYDPKRYELLGRLLDAHVAAGDKLAVNSFFNVSSMPNGKTDMNNHGAFSTDYIGANYTYPTNTYAARERMDREHRHYIQGMIHYLATSPRSPDYLRELISSWGPCKDEWTDKGGYSPQIYVREARRMVSDYVMTQADCQSARMAEDAVCLGSYNMDSHNCQRIVQNGVVRNEGDVQARLPKPYPISYRSLVPRRGECENLLVPFAISASHIAFGSTRMEPVFMMCAQAAVTAAVMAMDEGRTVQEVNYPRLAARLRADGQILEWGYRREGGIVVDNADAGVRMLGEWASSSANEGYLGGDYAHDGNTNKGAKSVTFIPTLPQGGDYEVYLRWTDNRNRATNVPVVIAHATGAATVTVNQTRQGGEWVRLFTGKFAAGTNASLTIQTGGTHGYIVADAARWMMVTNGVSPAPGK